MDAEFLEANRTDQYLAALLLVSTVAVAPLIVNVGLPELDYLIMTGHIRKLWVCISFLGLLVLLAGASLFAGIQHIRGGRSTIRTETHPVAGTRSLVRVRIVRGRFAVRLGRVRVALGILLTICAVSLFLLAGYALAILLPRL